MSKDQVSIERAKGCVACRLWDGRLAEPGKPLAVTVAQAADLLTRDPSEWVVPVASDLTIVQTEVKRRAAPKES